MDTKLLLIFIALNALNVIIQTAKSILTVKAGKAVAAFANAIAYGLYTIVLVYMVCDLPLAAKVAVVGGCNFVGVWFVKWLEEKMRREKLWKVECTMRNEQAQKFHEDLDGFGIPHSYITNVGKHTIFNIYCATQKDSQFVHEIADRANAKYFVTEGKEL